jgi:tetratricopeptide (TPR) repeat protein
LADKPGLADLEWEALGREALEAYIGGRIDEAVMLWRRAEDIAAAFAADDPRRAAGLNNLALAATLAEDFTAAESLFAAAAEAWQATRGWVETMGVQSVARSSLYHHRLELKYRDRFREHIRTRYRGWTDGAEAITAFNSGVLALCLDRDEAGRDLIERAAVLRQKAFGAANPELAVMLATLAGLSEAGGEAEQAEAFAERGRRASEDPTRNALERWAEDRPGEFNDARRLLAAVCLSALISERDFL